MNSEPITHLVNTAIECLLIVSFIAGAMIFINIRDDQANAYNTQIELQESVNKQMEFEGYNTGSDISNISECVRGNHVIETIRKYKDGSIRVYVDQTANGSINMTAAELELNPYLFSVAYLTDAISPSDYYHPFLIYDSDDMTNTNSYGTEVTGISFFKH